MKKQRDYTIPLLLALLLFAVWASSCQKSTLGVLVKDEWSGHFTRDSVFAVDSIQAKTLAFDCVGDTKWPGTKIESYNAGEPEDTARTWREIHPGGMTWIRVREIAPGQWERLYFNYEKKIKANGKDIVQIQNLEGSPNRGNYFNCTLFCNLMQSRKQDRPLS